MTPGQTDLARRIAADQRWLDGRDQLPDLCDDATVSRLMRLALNAGSDKGGLFADLTDQYGVNPGTMAAVILL